MKKKNPFLNLKNTSTFCYQPFHHINYSVDGISRPCPRGQPTGHISNKENGWNSSSWKNLRKDILNGVENSICSDCKALENSGATSYRQMSFKRQWSTNAFESYEPETGEMKTPPTEVELRFSNECNFRCKMCSPAYSSRWESFLRKRPEIHKKLDNYYEFNKESFDSSTQLSYNEALINSLEKWAPHLRSVLIAGGEPLIQKEHLLSLEKMKSNANNISLFYNTNLSTLSYKNHSFIPLWENFKSIILKVSIDGDPEIYSFVRKFSDTKKLENNIYTVQNELTNLEKIIGTFTASAFNILRIIEAVKYFTKLGLNFHTRQVQYPEIASTQVLPPQEKMALTKKVNGFLSNLEVNMEPHFKEHFYWEDPDKREYQLKSIKEHLLSTLNFMNFKDKSSYFKEFIEHDKLISQSSDKTLLDYYPKWKDYL